MKLFFDSVFFSYAQIFFSNKKINGILILISTFFNPLLGLSALLGLIISNFIAYLLKFDESKIKSGFYGFNGILFGASLFYYFEYQYDLILILIIFAVITFFISATLEHYLASTMNLPGLSLPFMITLYIFLIFISNFDFSYSYLHTFYVPPFLEFLPKFFKGYFQALGIILFQNNIIAGILIAISILIFSRVHFVVSLFAYTINYIFFNYLLPNQSDGIILISTFNSILTAIALGGSLIIISKKSLILVFFSSIVIIIFTFFFSKLLYSSSLPILVLPFNSVVLFTLYSLKFRQFHSDLVLLYFPPGSPEENFYYHKNRKLRFDKFTLNNLELPFYGEWFVSQGYQGNYTHQNKWKNALDFKVLDEHNKEYQNDGLDNSDYYCFKLPVLAPDDGKVVQIINSIHNNEIGKNNLKNNWGNTIVISHPNGIFSSFSHLDPNSIKYQINDFVKKGDILGNCGNSGRSPYPHLHFQIQKTEKIGDITIDYPISHYIERIENQHILRLYDIPKENSFVQNLELNKIMTNAFEFSLGSTFSFECNLNGLKFYENWEIKVNIYNNSYIQSSQGDILYFFKNDKVFFLSDYIGDKKSALYYFYLAANTVPLCFVENLFWTDFIPISKVLKNGISILTDFFLLLKDFIFSQINYNFNLDNDQNFILKSNLKITGESFFSFFNQNFEGFLKINKEGFIDNFIYMKNNKQVFVAQLIKDKEKINEKLLND